jgi:RNA polymerase sigma-70 factor (ECF subfamily)
MSDWASILSEHGATVWRTVYRLLNDHADALDCYQETFLAAWRLAERQPVVAWHALLVRLATRRAIDRLRQRVRTRARFTALDGVPEPATDAGCPLRQAGAAELLDRVRQALARLPPKQAEVFWLSCMEGQSHQQISQALHVSTGEVRVLLHRARAHLARVLEPDRSRGGNDHERELEAPGP